MGQIGGCAVASGLLSAGAAKIVASVLGPGGVAVLGTLQQCRETGAVAATLSGQTALVQGTSHLSGVERREFLRTAMCLMGGATVVVAVTMAAVPIQVARVVGLGVERAILIRWLSLPTAFASLYIFLNALVTALGAVRAVAGLQVAAPAVLLVLAYPAAVGASRGEESWFSILLAFSGAAAIAASAIPLTRHRRQLVSWLSGAGRWWSPLAARRFMLMSGAMLITGLASNWALVIVRAQIMRQQGLTVTGRFDAAWNIATNVSTLLLASIQAYHLPVLAKARGARERRAHLAGVLRVAAPAAALLVVGVAVLKPLILRLLYSPSFVPGAEYLRWTLPAVYLKVTSWVFAAPMLACADTNMFLATELTAWAVFFAGTATLARWCGTAESASIASLLMYVAHLALSSGYARRRHGFRWDVTGSVWVAGLGVVGAASAAYWSPSGEPGWGMTWILAAVISQVLLLRRRPLECAA
jgi:PST family polysaccharide transporter